MIFGQGYNESFRKAPGNRKFLDQERQNFDGNQFQNDSCNNELIEFIQNDLIGSTSTYNGPFGTRKVVYCDYIATGRALQSIETYINENVLPWYGNVHTTTSVTSNQSSLFQNEARLMIRNFVHANEHDAVIFTGNGVTGAVHKLISGLDLSKRPVVFVGPFEHHSNLLPWREIAFKVIRISENTQGRVNMNHLETALKFWKDKNFTLIGCFSAASNITGVLSNVDAITSLLHEYGAFAFWDYATAGPYKDINMQPSSYNASKDAVFLSMHKFVGGVDCPGVLVAKKTLFRNPVPSDSGGGSVFFVSQNSHRYLQDIEMREEGGTPRLVGIIRAALSMQLKETVGVQNILKEEKRLYNMVMDKWGKCSNLHILGRPNKLSSENQLAVFSFLIHHPDSKLYLHHNFVSALLNDLFGIQARGGCACAGPYAQDLLGIDEKTAAEFESALLEDTRLNRTHLRRYEECSSHEVLRPGFTRLSLPYFCSEYEVDFIIKSVAMLSEHGWKLLPLYMFNPETGQWKHNKHKVFTERQWIGDVKFTSSGLKINPRFKKQELTDINLNYNEVLKYAEKIFNEPVKYDALPDQRLIFSEKFQHLSWFLLPSDAVHYHSGLRKPVNENCPIKVRSNIKELTLDECIELVKVPEKFLQFDVHHKPITPVNTQQNSLEKGLTNRHTNNAPITAKTEKYSCIIPEQRPKSTVPLVVPSAAKSTCFIPPPKALFKLTVKAIDDFKMIKNNDKVLVCLSGGKDSLSLLHVLHQYQFYSKNKNINFHLGAVTIDPMNPSFDPSPLIPYLKTLNVDYFYEKQGIMDQATTADASSICAFCSRMKRGRIYSTARREGWNVLAFGQHLDDLAETFMMSAFHNGLLHTMKAHYTIKEGDLRVIRPFIYVREIETRNFAENSRLPVIPENCPACFEAPKERHRIKQLLAAQEILHPRLFFSLREALFPLMGNSKNFTQDLETLVSTFKKEVNVEE